MNGIRVLVVDDTREVRELFALTLERVGYEVTRADSGLAALQTLSSLGAPDAIILDYMMPGLSGPEMLRILRSDPLTASVPVILVTALDHEENIEEGLTAGATDYLTKPVDRRILLNRLDAAIKGHNALREASRVKALEREHTSLQMELRSAQALQMALVPPTPTRWGRWNATGTLAPCGAVGGDLFDVVERDDGDRVLVLLDVSGHGLASAMVAASVRSMLRLLLRRESLVAAAGEINRQLVGGQEDHYVCLGLVLVGDDATEVLNAGLPPIRVASGGEYLYSVEATGIPPGLLEGSLYESVKLPIVRGQRMVLLSDGVAEALGPNADTADVWAHLCLAGSPVESVLDALSLARSDGGALLRGTVEGMFPPTEEGRPDDVTVLILDDLSIATCTEAKESAA